MNPFTLMALIIFVMVWIVASYSQAIEVQQGHAFRVFVTVLTLGIALALSTFGMLIGISVHILLPSWIATCVIAAYSYHEIGRYKRL